ncbi:MAG TPA: hypothetical protein VMG36_08545 [Thermoplasmata archaeon]|nr:hypothetical protein [Thermoplasmata archaeon]
MNGPTGRGPRIAWVIVVVAVGFAIGAAAVALHPAPHGPPPPPSPGPAGSQNLGRIASVVSTLDLALLVALLGVYVRTYRDTRARFVLGLVIVLLALLVQAAASSPAVIGAFGLASGGLGGFYFVASLFEALALAVFLYLSLE